MSKTTALAAHASRFSLHFFVVPTQLQRGIVKFWVHGLKNRNDKAINLLTIPLWTRTRPPLFSSNTFSVLSIHWATWYEGEKVWMDAKSIFQRRFYWRLCFRIVRSLLDCILITSASILWFETNRQGFAGPKTAACDAWHNPLSKAVLPTNIKISVLQKWSSGRLYTITFPPKWNHLTDKPFKLSLYVSFEKSIRHWVNGRV